MKKITPVLTLIALLSAPLSAHAACSTPTADAGGMFYNTAVNAVQFCDGTDWYNAGLVVPTASGTSCTTPAGPEGGVFYNTNQNTVQFCNGDDWVNMGTMNFPSATGTTCSTPTGSEGSMFFNTTVNKMQFCNGDDWVNATYLTVAALALTETMRIQASTIQANAQFGYSVSISGDHAIVGAYGENAGNYGAGAAYIFKRTGVSWAQEAKIQAPDGESGDYFSLSVSISGDYAIVGAQNHNKGGAINAGAAYIFKRSGTIWTQEAKIQASDAETSDRFGRAVAIDGDYAIIGSGHDDDGGNASGSSYIFKRTGVSWNQEAKITASDAQAEDQFGYTSVSISGDYAVVGASWEDTGGSNAGAAYVFKRTGTSWVEESKIQANDKQTVDYFGQSVSINGDYVIVGAYGKDNGTGAAYIFKRSGSSWVQEAKLQSTDLEVGDNLGYSVAIKGVYAIVGAWTEDTVENGVGAAYIFKRTGASWTEESKIQASDKEANDHFGSSVAYDNGIAIVGSFNEDTGGANAGAAYIFD